MSLGVNLAGYLTSENGLGAAARGVAAALDAAQIPHTDLVLRGPHRMRSSYIPASGPTHPINLLVANADQLPSALAALPTEWRGRYTIGMWAWELASPPPDVGNVRFLDEVWAYSTFGLEALAGVADCPVEVAPLRLAISTEDASFRSELGLPDGPLFVYCFDYHSVFARKNPLGLVEAYRSAFPAEGEATLLLKSVNGAKHPEQLGQVRDRTRDRLDIWILDGYLDGAATRRLIASADAYVSLHRSEGFGLTVAEAMAVGTPVVATDYGGPRDFLTSETGYPVPWSPARVGLGSAPYGPSDEWAEPDLAVAAALLRSVIDHPDDARRRAGVARTAIEAQYGATAAADRIRSLLTAAAGRPTRAKPNQIDKADGVIQEPTSPRARAAWAVARRLRRLTGADESETRTRADLAFIAHAHAELAAEVELLRERVDAVPSGSPMASLAFDARHEPEPAGDFWSAFRTQFRGSDDRVASRLPYYVDLLGSVNGPVVDLGCGRGDLVAALRDKGVAAVGVDTDEKAVAGMRSNGLPAEHADALGYLRACEPESLSAVIGVQMIEHLGFDELRQLVEAAHASLRDGGLLVLETVNPAAIAALKAFWIDPSHVQPIYAETALILARTSGFGVGRIEFPYGTGDFAYDRVTSGEYTLIARR